MMPQPISMQDLANEVRDLRLRVNSLTALLVALPESVWIDNEKARSALDKIIDPALDKIEGDQVARAMAVIQSVTELRK
jgi:hypothetical protein